MLALSKALRKAYITDADMLYSASYIGRNMDDSAFNSSPHSNVRSRIQSK